MSLRFGFESVAVLTGLLAVACAPKEAAREAAPAPQAPLVSDSATAAAPEADPHSAARPWEVAVTNLDLDLRVDFDAKQLVARARLDLARKNPSAPLRLDTRDLEIAAVHLDSDPAPAKFELGEAKGILGRDLTIPLAAGTKAVTIEYRTSPGAAALQWLSPEQTAGGRRPFLFSQSQAILARTWVPCQDSPAVRMTYSATVHVPADLLALMSATNPQSKSADGVYRFSMPNPIPSYLLALSVGDLEFRALGSRSGVYAEPPVIEKAAWELADTEKMIAAAEKLYGPYRWERYDLLILPPSFPFGGMENPRLTFATPTMLAGDRSLVALVAHELAHSWSGNLVTNATWNDFWLNEGFTTYFENRITEAVYGRENSEMLAVLSRQELEEHILRAEPRATWLYADSAGKDPDDAIGPIAYDKGFFFLRALEEAAGRAEWDAFLRSYFDSHAFESMTTAKFVEILNRNLLAHRPDVAAKVDIQAWIYGPGLPANAPQPKAAAFDKVDAELARFSAGTPAAELATAGWVTQQWQRFLRALPEKPPLDQLADLDKEYQFTSSGNSEILADWFRLTIASGYAPADAALEKFLSSVGRRKFIVPLYRALASTPDGLARAKAIYARARPGYHPLAQGSLDAILN